MAANAHTPSAIVTIVLILATLIAHNGVAATAGPPLLDTQQRAQPVWAQQRSQDIQLDFSTADPEFERFKRAEGEYVFKHYKSRRVKVRSHSGWYYGNTALVRYGSEFVMAVRRMSFFRTNQSVVALEDQYHPMKNDLTVDWWQSTVLLCSVHATQLIPLSCKPFDPRPWRECLWDGVFEGTGIEDPRLVVWPGKGLFMIFGSKPPAVEQTGDLTPWRLRCGGPVVFQQYMVRLNPPPGSGGQNEDAWGHGVVPLVYDQHQHQRHARQRKRFTSSNSGGSSGGGSSSVRELRESQDEHSSSSSRRMRADGSNDDTGSSGDQHDEIKEKNWNPFVYKGQLLFSHSFMPEHVVLQPLPNDTCVQRFVTPNPVMLKAFAGTPARGNTQAVLVPSAQSSEARSYYLGIVHVEANRSYSNHFYKMQPAPPFHVLAVSAAVPVQGRQHVAVQSWEDVSFPMSLDVMYETGMVIIGYGSGDSAAHVKLMPLREVQALFGTTADAASAHALAHPVPAKGAAANTKQAAPAPGNKAGKGKGSNASSSSKSKSWRPWPPNGSSWGSKGSSKSGSTPNAGSSSNKGKLSRHRHTAANSGDNNKHKRADDVLTDADEEEQQGVASSGQHIAHHSAVAALLGAAPAGALGSAMRRRSDAAGTAKAQQ